jgi:hypothetical protein
VNQVVKHQVSLGDQLSLEPGQVTPEVSALGLMSNAAPGLISQVPIYVGGYLPRAVGGLIVRLKDAQEVLMDRHRDGSVGVNAISKPMANQRSVDNSDVHVDSSKTEQQVVAWR